MKTFAGLGLAKTSKHPLDPKPCGVMGDNFGVSRGVLGWAQADASALRSLFCVLCVMVVSAGSLGVLEGWLPQT